MSSIIAQITDLHLDDKMAVSAGINGREHTQRIFKSITEQGIKDIVFTGDIGTPESHRWLLDTVTRYGLHPLFTLGNHDEPADFKNFAAVAGFMKPDGLYYALERSGIRCIFLDSCSGLVGDVQCAWLVEQLAAANDLAALFTHFPVLDCGDTYVDRKHPLRNRDLVKKLLIQSSKHIFLFCGHYHTYHERCEDNIHQYLTPSALVQIKQHAETVTLERETYGYRVIRLSRNRIESRVVLLR
jgi:3',5'-cyclic AMP phosphodiesterase CpdA